MEEKNQPAQLNPSNNTISENLPPNKEEKNKKLVKIFAYALAFVTLVTVSTFGVWLYQEKTNETKNGTTPQISSTPTPPSREFRRYFPGGRGGNFDVVLKENQRDETKTDVYLKNKTTEQEESYMTLTDVYWNHYHAVEYLDDNLYIIRRIGYEGYPDEEWSDELWKYNPDKKGINLFSSKGVDFRLSTNGEFAAIRDSHERIVFLNLKTNNIEREFSDKELGAYVVLNPKAGPTNLAIDLDQWSDNCKYFWVSLSASAYPLRIIKIKINGWTMDKFDVSDLSLSFVDLNLNPNTAKVVFSNYPVFFDVDSQKEYETKENIVTLFLYDLPTRNKQIINTSINKPFKPAWVNDNTIEYDDPQGSGRITFDLK
jgi:hypothetical protein